MSKEENTSESQETEGTTSQVTQPTSQYVQNSDQSTNVISKKNRR